jgi:hypothetical protein
LAAGLTLPFASAASASVVITVDKNTQRMLVAVDGVTRYEWAVSTGRRGFDTPDGAFRPNRMEAEHFSKEYENAPMPHSIFFDMNGHAIHGFSDTPHLGLAVSHGCVRLSPANAAILFSLVKAEGMGNTKVVIQGHIPSTRAPLVAQRPQPTEEAATEPAPPPSAYGAQPAPYYAQQPAPYGQPTYGQRTFPQQPAPVYGRPVYGQYRQPSYAQPYGQPVYQQPQYDGPYSRY